MVVPGFRPWRLKVSDPALQFRYIVLFAEQSFNGFAG
jgi:hypothetical protein